MEQHILITMSADDLQSLVKRCVREVEKEKNEQVSLSRSYSFNQAAKELGRSFTTIKKLIMEGKLKTTSDGKRIPAQALNDYLKEPG